MEGRAGEGRGEERRGDETRGCRSPRHCSRRLTTAGPDRSWLATALSSPVSPRPLLRPRLAHISPHLPNLHGASSCRPNEGAAHGSGAERVRRGTRASTL